MTSNHSKDPPPSRVKNSLFDTIRQWRFPAEFRIPPPAMELALLTDSALEAYIGVDADEEREEPNTEAVSDRLLAEMATCFWYLKTKHFKRKWEDDGTETVGDDSPQTRRVFRRLQRAIDVLGDVGVEIYDPTNKRYAPGAEGMMRPIEFQPTRGLTVDVVTETVMPVVFRGDQLIQRGEVFVAVPENQGSQADQDEPNGHAPSSRGNGEQEGADAEHASPDENAREIPNTTPESPQS